MTADFAKTPLEAADWHALDPRAPQIALVGPMDFAPQPVLETRLKNLPQIAVDGGLRHATRPLLWVGDGDSSVMPQDIPALQKPSQDETDLRFCLNGIRRWQWQVLHLFGFLGGRKDHELANMGEIHAEMLARPAMTSAILYGETGMPCMVLYNKGAHEMTLQTRFSLLALAPMTVSIEGDCDFPAQNLALPVLSGQGISNIGHGMVTVTADMPFFIIL